MTRQSVSQEAIERTLNIVEDAKERAREVIGYWLGMEPAPIRWIRDLIRRARAGDAGPLLRVKWLYEQQPYPEALDAEIHRILDEEGEE